MMIPKRVFHNITIQVVPIIVVELKNNGTYLDVAKPGRSSPSSLGLVLVSPSSCASLTPPPSPPLRFLSSTLGAPWRISAPCAVGHFSLLISLRVLAPVLCLIQPSLELLNVDLAPPTGVGRPSFPVCVPRPCIFPSVSFSFVKHRRSVTTSLSGVGFVAFPSLPLKSRST